MTVHQLTRQQARRIAVQAQLLDRPRPTDLVEVVGRLTLLQLDPTAAVAPNADLVLWSRLGSSYRPEQLRDALDRRLLIEHQATIRSRDYLTLLRDDMATWPGTGELRPWQQARQAWVQANDACRRDILSRLTGEGPLPSRELPDTCAVPWESTGWTHNKNVSQLLELMEVRGEVAVVGRRGRDRLWDLASRVHPDDPAVSADEARRQRDERRLAALGIARARTAQVPVEPADVGEAGEAAVVAGVPGEWRVHPSYLGRQFTGRAALLSPFDRLVHDRKRSQELFGFEYQLEMYKPAARRRWGYFALPVLYDDRLVGKLDAKADRKAGVLRVHALHEDVAFSRAMTTAVHREIDDLARWLGLEVVTDQGTATG